MVEVTTCPNISPFECALQLIDDIEAANGVAIDDLLQVSYVRLALMLCPGVKTIVPDENTIFYRVEPFAAYQINVSATGNREAYDMLSEICRANIFTGEPVPPEMRGICSQLVAGQFKPPSKRGPKPRPDFGLFFVSYLIAKYLCDAYELPKTRGDGMDETSAADVVSRALNKRGLDASYTKIRDFLTHRKHEFSREKSDWIREMMYEPYLAELGLISRKRVFGVSPFGTFFPIPSNSANSRQ